MNVKRLLSFLAAPPLGLMAVVGLFAIGCDGACDEHPRPGAVENERVAEAPEEVHEGQPSQAGAVGSELAAHTEGLMEQCIEVIANVRDCSVKQPFIDALIGEESAADEGLTSEKLGVLADFWREPGAVRQSCDQLFSEDEEVDLEDEYNPFRDPEALALMAGAADEQCLDFAAVLREAKAVEPIGDIDL